MFLIINIIIFLALYIFDIRNRKLRNKCCDKEIKTYKSLLLFPIYKYKDSDDILLKKLCRNIIIERVWFTVVVILFIVEFFTN